MVEATRDTTDLHVLQYRLHIGLFFLRQGRGEATNRLRDAETRLGLFCGQLDRRHTKSTDVVAGRGTGSSEGRPTLWYFDNRV